MEHHWSKANKYSYYKLGLRAFGLKFLLNQYSENQDIRIRYAKTVA